MISQSCYAGYDHGVTGDMANLAAVWPTTAGIRFATDGFPAMGSSLELRNKDRYLEWERLGF